MVTLRIVGLTSFGMTMAGVAARTAVIATTNGTVTTVSGVSVYPTSMSTVNMNIDSSASKRGYAIKGKDHGKTLGAVIG